MAKNSGMSRQSQTILICIIVGLAGLYYGVMMNASTGTSADQYTFYSDEVTISSVGFEPDKVSWASSDKIKDLTLSIEKYDSTAQTCKVTVGGFILSKDDLSGTITLSKTGQTDVTQAFTLDVEPNNTNLAILGASAIMLLFGLYCQFVRRN